MKTLQDIEKLQLKESTKTAFKEFIRLSLIKKKNKTEETTLKGIKVMLLSDGIKREWLE